MKVCIVTTAFPRWPTDHLGNFILEAARAVHAQGVEVRVIGMHHPGAKTKEVLKPDIEVIRPRYMWPEAWEVLQTEGGGLPSLWKRRPLARPVLIPFFISHTLAIMRHARDCDIIHANWTLAATAAWVGCFFHHRPFLVTVQGSDIFEATRIPFVSSITRAVLNSAFKVLALSNSLKEATVALGVPPEHVEIVPNGVDINKYQPPTSDRQPLIIFVGWLIERKGVGYLVRAMTQIQHKLNQHRLLFIGEGPLRTELSKLAAEIGIADRVQFLGQQPPEEVSKWLRRAELLVLPSLEEGLGVVLLEALASGTPCVASRVGGIQEVLSPEVGILVEPANVNELAQAIIDILSDRDRWMKLSRNARALAEERFSWEVIASRLVEIYKECLGQT